MENFDLFTPILEGKKKHDKLFYILGVRGDDSYKRKHYSTRKTESANMTNLELLIYSEKNEEGTIFWKCTYKNSKGVYMNKKNKKNKKYYIKDLDIK